MKNVIQKNSIAKVQKTQQAHAEGQKTVPAQQSPTAENPKEQSPPPCKAQVQQSMSESENPQKPLVKRENYCKFERVEKSLSQMLERSVPEKEMAANLKISLPTLHKYKNLLTVRDKKIYMTPEEERFLKRHCNAPTATPTVSPTPATTEKGGKP